MSAAPASLTLRANVSFHPTFVQGKCGVCHFVQSSGHWTAAENHLFCVASREHLLWQFLQLLLEDPEDPNGKCAECEVVDRS